MKKLKRKLKYFFWAITHLRTWWKWRKVIVRSINPDFSKVFLFELTIFNKFEVANRNRTPSDIIPFPKRDA